MTRVRSDASRRRCLAATGHGLVGMRERVAMYHGDLEVGPGPIGGFRVAARLPFGAAT